jgi:hypothetical protein
MRYSVINDIPRIAYGETQYTHRVSLVTKVPTQGVSLWTVFTVESMRRVAPRRVL